MRRFLGWGVLLLLVALVAGTYLSGWLMAWRLGLPLERIGAFDYWRYLAAYADAPKHGPVIKSSGLVGFGVPLLALSALVLAVFLPRLRETRLVRPISRTELAIRVIRANVMAEWLFELLPARVRRSKSEVRRQKADQDDAR